MRNGRGERGCEDGDVRASGAGGVMMMMMMMMMLMPLMMMMMMMMMVVVTGGGDGVSAAGVASAQEGVAFAPALVQ